MTNRKNTNNDLENNTKKTQHLNFNIKRYAVVVFVFCNLNFKMPFSSSEEM